MGQCCSRKGLTGMQAAGKPPLQRLARSETVHAPRCGWLLPLCALCNWLCCSAICQNAASVSQNFIARTVPLQLAFGALIVCGTMQSNPGISPASRQSSAFAIILVSQRNRHAASVKCVMNAQSLFVMKPGNLVALSLHISPSYLPMWWNRAPD